LYALEAAMKKLTILFLLNGIFNIIGAVVLAFAPVIGPFLGLVGSDAAFIWRLLAVCSFSLGILSFLGMRFNERFAIISAITVFCIFHGASALVSILEIFGGLPAFVFGNTAIHLLFLLLFILFSREIPKNGSHVK
jgi:hypothetical protein